MAGNICFLKADNCSKQTNQLFRTKEKNCGGKRLLPTFNNHIITIT